MLSQWVAINKHRYDPKLHINNCTRQGLSLRKLTVNVGYSIQIASLRKTRVRVKTDKVTGIQRIKKLNSINNCKSQSK